MAPPPAAALPVPDVDDDEADAEHDALWEAELDRRIADVREGRVQLVSEDQVFSRLDAALAERRRARALTAGR